MGDALSIFLQSRFDATGVQDATRSLNSVQQQIAQLKKSGEIFNIDPTQFLGREQESLQAINAQIEGYKRMSQVLGDAAKGALRLQDATRSGALTALKKETDAEIKSLESLITEEDRLKLALDRSNQSEGASIPLIQARIEQKKREAQVLREVAQSEAARGNVDSSQDYMRQAAATQRAADELGKLTDKRFIDTGMTKEQSDKMRVHSALMKVLGSTFNQLGFAMFVTASTARMFFQIFEGGFNALSEGAAILDRQNAFNQLLSGEGIDTSGLTAKLQQAAQGLVPIDLAIRKSLQLAKAGFPEMAAQSDQILAIAVNSAKVSGELDQVETIYDKLIRGIIRGSPRLIDDADIILKLGDSNEAYAASLGKTVEELTAAEKVQATFNAVIQEGQRINEMADQVDSTAAAYQRLKTDVTELTNALKETFAIAATGLSGTDENKGIFRQLADAQDSVNVVAEGFRGIGESMPVWRALSAQASLGTEAFNRLAEALSSGEINMLQFREIAAHTGTLLSGDVLSSTESWIELFGGIQQESNSADKALLNFLDSVTSASATTLDLSGITDPIAEMRLQLIDTGLAFIDVREKMVEAEQNFGAKMVDLRSDMSQKMRDITDSLGDKLIDLQESYNDKILDIEQGLADKREDINSDLADKLAGISTDIQEKRESEYSKHTQKIEDIEKSHQEKIAEIMRQFEMSRTKALIDRDALALFEAERRRDEDLRSAEEDAQKKRSTETDEYRKTTEDLAKEEEKRRQQAQAEAEKRRQDAQKQADRQRRDALDQYEKQQEDAADAAEKARAEAIKNYAQQQKDAIDNYAEQKADFANWNTERLREQQQAALNRQFQQLQDQIKEEGYTLEHIQSLKALWKEYQQFVQNVNLTPSGTGDGTTPGTTPSPTPSPTPPPPSNGTDNIVAGAFCNVQSGTAYTGADGRQYLCVGRQWVLVSDVFPGGGGVAGVSGGSVAGGGTTGSAQPTGGQQVVIRVENDKTLEAILNELTYSAVIEVISA